VEVVPSSYSVVEVKAVAVASWTQGLWEWWVPGDADLGWAVDEVRGSAVSEKVAATGHSLVYNLRSH